VNEDTTGSTSIQTLDYCNNTMYNFNESSNDITAMNDSIIPQSDAAACYVHDDSDDDRRIVLRTMKALERTVYKRPHSQNLPGLFRGLWRRQIVEWMYILVKYCKLKHEATAAAVYYLDKAIEGSALVQTPRDYQLCAMTALHLALKVYDSPSVRVVKLSCLVKLGNGEFTEDDIIQKEQDLVRALGWRIHPPTPNCFLQRYMELLPFHGDGDDGDDSESDISDAETIGDDQPEERRRERLHKLEEIASDYIEVALARDRFLSVPPSVIAYSAMLSAMELTTEHQQHCGYDWVTFLQNMRDVAEMGDIMHDDKTSTLRSVRRTKVLLDRIAQGLPLPAEEDNNDEFYTGANKHKSNEETFVEFVDASMGLSASSPPSPTSTRTSTRTAATTTAS
jgi:hypothetical protein